MRSAAGGRSRSSRPFAVFVGLALAALSLSTSLSACSSSSAAATPASEYTSVPIAPTPWANGTTGQYGLRIDPSLLKRLPIAVGGIALTEDTLTEQIELDDQGIASTVDSMAAAAAGEIGDTDWLKVEIVHFKVDSQTDDVYGQWIDGYAAQVCQQANGTGSSTSETINDWVVDFTSCNGGVDVYSLSLGDGEYMSMFDDGPKDLGKLLISNLF